MEFMYEFEQHAVINVLHVFDPKTTGLAALAHPFPCNQAICTSAFVLPRPEERPSLGVEKFPDGFWEQG